MTYPITETAKIGAAMPRCPHVCCGCADVMHGLAKSVTGVLITARVLEWKLPPYSRLKRTVREIERRAQRSAALLKDLLDRSAADQAKQEGCGRVSASGGNMAAVAAPGPTAMDGGRANLPAPPPSPMAPDRGFFSEIELTSVCDRCTSAFFPKEER
jgi:hypothetical protein